jgi:hypothetical protein
MWQCLPVPVFGNHKSPSVRVATVGLNPSRRSSYPKEIAKVELPGTAAPLKFTRDATGLLVTLPDLKPNDFACCFKITAKS